MPVANQAQCIRTAGTAKVGRKITRTGFPDRWQLPGSPYIGATYDSCARRVSVYFGSPPGNAFRWNIGYGQRENSTRVVFSHQRQYNDNASNVGRVASDWFTDDHPNPRVYAFFRVQSCTENLARLCPQLQPLVAVADHLPREQPADGARQQPDAGGPRLCGDQRSIAATDRTAAGGPGKQ